MNLEVRHAITAKTLLQYGNLSVFSLIKSSYEEARLKTEHFKNSKPLVQKTIKVFKNTLKQFSKKKLIKQYCDHRVLHKLNTIADRLVDPNELTKKYIIDGIFVTYCNTIIRVIKIELENKSL